MSPSTALLRARLRTERRAITGIAVLVGASSLIPLAGPLLLGRFVDQVLVNAPRPELTRLALFYLAVVIVAEALSLIVVWATERVGWRIGNTLRHDLADHVFGHSLAWHGETSPGVLIERIDGDTAAVAGFFEQGVVVIVGNVILLAGVFVVVFLTDVRLGLVLSTVAVIGVVVLYRLRQFAVEAHEAEREAGARLYGELEERLGGVEDIRANGAGPWVMNRFHHRSNTLWHATRRASWRSAGSWTGARLVFAIGTVSILATSIWLHRLGALSVGAVFVLWRYSELVRDPLIQIAEQMREMQKALAGAARAAKLLAEDVALPSGAERLPAGALELRFDDVSLAYDGENAAVEGMTFTVPPGTSLGLVGRTGSGKTTLGRLALRFWDPTSGEVAIAGQDLRSVDNESLRARTSVVSQEVLVLQASVRDNLTLFGSAPVTDADLVQALVDVGLSGWLARLDDGLDSVIGGVGALSAGEAQLLAFARALVRDPGLVVLDEATARLDPGTQERLAAATHRLLTDRTAIVIAHRVATLDEVDYIGVVDGGQLIEFGPRADLLARADSHYAGLVQAGSMQEVLA